MQKQCSKCKEIYENAEENFYKVPRLKSGFSSWCKKCHYEKDLSYIKTEIGNINSFDGGMFEVVTCRMVCCGDRADKSNE